MIQLNKYETAATYFFLTLNPLDSQKTKLLKDKIVDFSINNHLPLWYILVLGWQKLLYVVYFVQRSSVNSAEKSS